MSAHIRMVLAKLRDAAGCALHNLVLQGGDISRRFPNRRSRGCQVALFCCIFCWSTLCMQGGTLCQLIRCYLFVQLHGSGLTWRHLPDWLSWFWGGPRHSCWRPGNSPHWNGKEPHFLKRGRYDNFYSWHFIFRTILTSHSPQLSSSRNAWAWKQR